MADQVSSILSFPSARPAADSAGFVVQKGVSYIGRKDTDGPAVWEVICDAFGLDSLEEGLGDIGAMFRRFLTAWFYNLPTSDPGVMGAPFLDGNFVVVDTDGKTPIGDTDLSDIPVGLRVLFQNAISNYISELPDGPLKDAVSKNGNFINVDNS